MNPVKSLYNKILAILEPLEVIEAEWCPFDFRTAI